MQKQCLFTNYEMTVFHGFFFLFDISTVNPNVNTGFCSRTSLDLNTIMINYTIATFLWFVNTAKLYTGYPFHNFIKREKIFITMNVTELRKSTDILSKNVVLALECSNAVDKKTILITLFILKKLKDFSS